jgi:transketolase
MRTAFIKTLCEVAAEDERIWLLCGDLGYSVLEEFADRFPARFVNVGIAEQNMIGMAAGLAMCGKVVFIYSIANFPTLRCLEQIRNDLCYHNLNVNIVSVGAGFTYGAHGYTHHGLEDLAIMRALPNIQVIAPGDPVETRLITRSTIDSPSPSYMRLGKAGEPTIHQDLNCIETGKMILVRSGTDALIISTGGMLFNAVEAAKLAHIDGKSVAVWSCPFVKPLDREAILEATAQFSLILTVEEGTKSGGLGGVVAEVIATNSSSISTHLVTIGTNEEIISQAYNQSEIRKQIGLDSEGIYHTLLSSLRNINSDRLFSNNFEKSLETV